MGTSSRALYQEFRLPVGAHEREGGSQRDTVKLKKINLSIQECNYKLQGMKGAAV